MCTAPLPPGRVVTCSLACGNDARRQWTARVKAAVLAALGGQCSCQEANCWHPGSCPVTHPDGLSVDHTKNDGGRARRTRRDGTLRAPSARAGQMAWRVYQRQLTEPTHGLRLLCHTCHFIWTAQQHRAQAASRLAAPGLLSDSSA